MTKNNNLPSANLLKQNGELRYRVAELQKNQQPCRICPHHCLVSRINHDLGICEAPRQLKISSAFAHFGEEPELVGVYGSGTIFLSHCNLRCVYCQNYQISHLGEGRFIQTDEMAVLMIRLQRGGCHNINFVTPTHYVPQIIEAVEIALDLGLSIPLVYNCSGYESTETLQLLEGIIDIYMPDFKYAEPKSSEKYSNTPDYFEIAKNAILEMYRQTGDLIVEQGIAKKGLLIRHLVLPGQVDQSKIIMEFIAHNLSVNTYVNIMSQYHPCYLAQRYPPINRPINYSEVKEVKQYARKLGLHRGF